MKNFFLKKTKLSVPLLCVAFFIGGVIFAKLIEQPVLIKSKTLREAGYKYTNPVLLCNINNNQKYNEDADLSGQFSNYKEKYPENNISVYFLSLSGNGWASMDGDNTYSPASMLKVPTVVEILKYQESNPKILSKKIYYDGSFDDNKAEHFRSKEGLKKGQYYSVSDLISYTIKYSDNNAVRLLHDIIKPESFEKLYNDLKIEIPPDALDFMSPKTYSLFLRVLYNSTYLTPEMSEKVLGLMVSSDFPNGLKGGVPKGVDVAEKFGERQIYTPEGNLTNRELHDCGIVYLPNKTYILCVMTRGKDFDSLSNNIKDISKMVYDHETE